MPLADCNAMSQGYIGAQLTVELMNQFRHQDIMRTVANVPTHVVVDADDPAFKDYEKPIGAFMIASEARTYMEQGQFAPGSMLPKVQACVKFVEAHPGGRAVITSLDHAADFGSAH